MTIITVGKKDATIGVVPESHKISGLPEPAPAGIFDHIFTRNVVSKKEQPQLIKEVQGRIQDGENVFVNQVMSGRSAFRYDYSTADGRQVPVLLKYTGGDFMQGNDPQDVRNTMAEFLRGFQPKSREEVGMVPDPKGYEVHMPRYYGRVNENAIAMEYIDGKSADKLLGALEMTGDFEVRDSLNQALRNYETDLRKNLDGHPRMQNMLGQASQVMVAGHTNPTDLEKGRWVFFVPPDYE